MLGRTVLLVLFLLPALAGCATDRTFGTAADIEITELERLPEPTLEILYRIGPQELLRIDVVGAPQLSGTFLTNEQGDVGYPLLGVVPLAGASPSEASALIAEGLRGQYLLDPQVRVIPNEFPPPSISVGGQVKVPGSYPAVGRPTLLRVINQAQGLDQYAKLDDVLVMRRVDGQNYIGLYNIGAIQRGNYEDPLLYPNDIVMVGDSPGSRRLDSILQFAPILTSAIVLIDRVGQP